MSWFVVAMFSIALNFFWTAYRIIGWALDKFNAWYEKRIAARKHFEKTERYRNGLV